MPHSPRTIPQGSSDYLGHNQQLQFTLQSLPWDQVETQLLRSP